MMETVSGMRCPLKRARFAVAVAALIGVLAMHGFSSDHAFAASAITASSGEVDARAAETGMAHHGMIPAGVTYEHAVEANSAPRLHSATVAGASHCAMSHAECLATLRDTAHLKNPANAGLPVATHLPALQRPAAATVVPVAGRAPPDVSLTGLCISRT
jgi:hypothetical protein